MSMNKKGNGDFSIGSEVWPGLSKLIEEAGEVMQVAGKLIGSRGQIAHFDGTDLKIRLEDELADLQAAIEFVSRFGNLNFKRMDERRNEKIDRFENWHDTDSVYRE